MVGTHILYTYNRCKIYIYMYIPCCTTNKKQLCCMRERGKCSSLLPFHCITGNSIFLSKGFSSTEIKRHTFCKIHENIRPTRKWNWVEGRQKERGKTLCNFPHIYTSLPPHLFNIYALHHSEKFVYFSSVCALCTLNQYFHTWEVKGLGCSAKHTVRLKDRIIIYLWAIQLQVRLVMWLVLTTIRCN